MKKTMIYLPEETHEGLRKLAFEKHVSIAELIRVAVDSTYGKGIEDVTTIKEVVAEYKARPKEATSLDAYIEQGAERLMQSPHPQGALALAGAWREVKDRDMASLVEDIYAAREKDTGRPVELDA